MENHNETEKSEDLLVSLEDQFESIVSSLATFKMQLSTIQTQIRGVEKTVKKEIKNLRKESLKNKTSGKKKLSGFATPTKITNELCEFMNKEKGTEIARTDVTKTLIEYIKKNKLENSENSQIINPDEKLKDLLGIDEKEKLTYFTLQKHMNKHFIKQIKSLESEN
jgi:upstream activation factor subunit UAF30